ncbi:hypothetical protein GCM10009765_32510 [Fodinicola feengrottensis]|uniref:Uncharacterized protein n=1 Tax=Fodinicola feengrottensis TaxID=435914 RepID=A0ABN2H2D4_9ACTN
MAFPTSRSKDTAYADLDDRQQRLVRTLAHSPNTWLWGDRPFGNFSGMIDAYGLPSSVEKLLAYCEPSG